jgi:hypothetical protein
MTISLAERARPKRSSATPPLGSKGRDQHVRDKGNLFVWPVLSKKEDHAMKTIRQSVTFKASPHDVYEALMDSKKHGRFTGSRARISRKVGGAIMAYDDYVRGENVRLIPDRIIEQ